MNLVTGATGIIGSHVLLSLLLQNKPVRACRQKGSDILKTKKLFHFYQPGHQQLWERVEWIELDVLDQFAIEDALEGVSHVYHCAGFVSFKKSDRKQLFRINEQGTRNVVNACLQKGNVALCHVSTIGTINNSDHRGELNESVFWKTSGKESDYALSKYNAEREVWRGMEEGMEAVIVNPGVVLSPVFWTQSSAQLFSQCYKGNRFYTSGSTAYVSAPDVATAMVRLMEEKKFGQRFILIENNYPFRQIFNHIQNKFGKPLPDISAGKTLLNAGRFFSWLFSLFSGKDPLLTKSLINAALNTQTYSGEKVKNELGLQFEPVEKVLDRICDYYLIEASKSSSSV